MIKEFFNQMKETTPLKITTVEQMEEQLPTLQRLLDGYVALLSNYETFPHQEINKLLTLLEALISHEYIMVTVDASGRVLNMEFDVLLEEKRPDQGMIFFPQNILSLAANNPETLIGMFVFVASQCRDYFVGKLPPKNREELGNSRLRAMAFEVEALKTLEEIATAADVELNLPSFQTILYEVIPKGLDRLVEDGLDYPTPEFRATPGLNFDATLN